MCVIDDGSTDGTAAEAEAYTLVEDMDWAVQLHRRGEEIIYAPNATVYSQNPRTLHDYIGQISRWYRGTWQIIKLHQIGCSWRRLDAEFVARLGEMYLFIAFMGLLPLWLVLIPQSVKTLVRIRPTKEASFALSPHPDPAYAAPTL